MKYIQTNEELINEKISWRGVIYGLCIAAMIKHYFPGKKKLTKQEMHEIITDIDNRPTGKESILIKNVKTSLINDIMSENNLDTIQKNKLVNKINTIPFISVDKETIELVSGSEGTLGCYFVYLDGLKLVKVILVNNERLTSDTSFSETILHELRHLVDNTLSNDSDKEYSELSNIIEILDKDIIVGNKEGQRKLKEKINIFVKKVAYNILEDKSRINSPKVKEVIKDLEKDYYGIIYLDKEKMDYLTSPGEIYVRFHGLKRWMIKNGYLKDMNDQITQDMIIKMLDDPKVSDKNFINKDFFQILFFLNIDLHF